MQLENKLKEVNTQTLEAAIAKTISEVTGWNYSCTIRSIQYDDVGKAELKIDVETSDWLRPKFD